MQTPLEHIVGAWSFFYIMTIYLINTILGALVYEVLNYSIKGISFVVHTVRKITSVAHSRVEKVLNQHH